jgi:ribosome maturation factor RimP
MTTRIPETLEKFVAEEADKLGYELVDISTRGGGGFFLEILIDKEGGITIGECGKFNRTVSSWIESQGLFRGSFTIDVSSPGLDRVLKKDKDFSRAVGKQVRVKMREPVNGKSALVGKLLGTDDEKGLLIEEEDGNEVSIKKDNVAKARLWASI